MDKIARIRREIERLKGICTAQIKVNPGQTFPFVMEMTGYDKLLSFLDTMDDPEVDLSIKDVELLHTFLYAVKNNKQGIFTFTSLSDEQYQEVLRRFKNAK